MSDQRPFNRRVTVVASEKPSGARRRHFRGGLRLLGIGALIQLLVWLASQSPQVAQSGSLLPVLLPLMLASVALELLGLFRLLLSLVDLVRGRIKR